MKKYQYFRQENTDLCRKNIMYNSVYFSQKLDEENYVKVEWKQACVGLNKLKFQFRTSLYTFGVRYCLVMSDKSVHRSIWRILPSERNEELFPFRCEWKIYVRRNQFIFVEVTRVRQLVS